MELRLSNKETAFLRMVNQQIGGTRFDQPADLVHWMGCIQAQDYGMAKWAVGCRLAGASDRSVGEAFQTGRILRTHVLRPTWHFVHPADIRWMLRITAPKVKAQSAPYHRKLGIDSAILKKSKKVIAGALTKHPRLTRDALTQALMHEKIDVSEGRIGFLLMDAELDALICSAGREGKQFAFQLLDEVVPTTKLPDEQESIGELARRYFLSRGPAGLADFAWWGGLTMAEARLGLEMNRRSLQQVDVNGKEYWFVPGTPPAHMDTVLIPAFDEFCVAYKLRDEVLDPCWIGHTKSGLSPVVVHQGEIVGVWSRELGNKSGGSADIRLFKPLRASRALAAAEQRYKDFIAAE
jgi:hypothetical protein